MPVWDKQVSPVPLIGYSTSRDRASPVFIIITMGFNPLKREIKMNKIILSSLVLVSILLVSCGKQADVRQDILLNNDWQSIACDTSKTVFDGFQEDGYATNDWITIDVPHNWDDYGGYRRMMHGNRHGYAWYRKSFQVDAQNEGKQIFLWFEGVGSYATVWVNGKEVGAHAGGRTSFTIDVTDAVKLGQDNLLAVRADHPKDIRDLPWVCGGCSTEWGFSEGSQPMGIFRPVHMIVTNPVRVEPFGVHIWNDNQITEKEATLNIDVELKNYASDAKTVKVINRLVSANGKKVAQNIVEKVVLAKSELKSVSSKLKVDEPQLWDLENPYMYTLHTEVYENGHLVDAETTEYGIRHIKWDIFGDDATHRFFLNGKPVFINGTAEYEHMLGQGHAFSDEQVAARTQQMLAMGYNAYRDAHQPHNLRYQKVWDEQGILWWPQMAAHIWFDNPDFKKNFKQLLRDWIKERRNSPSIILWGLENESTLPEEFAKECTEIIREMDPTASSQRLVTTCNGGSGTDWNVIQNWSGTYGGKPEEYDKEISEQWLNGEYGAWRSIDLHSEGEFDAKGVLSEDRMNLLMESKIRLAEKASDKCCGQFHWLFNSHDNPGRIQSGEGLRDIDRLGPVNYKGAISIWGEPLDLFYMFRANYVDKHEQPMVYIVSHTWPDRWTSAGEKSGIRIFSNCDEVELFNGVNKNSLGRQKQPGRGNHFVFDNVSINNNVLYAVGYVDGKQVVNDCILLHHLPVNKDDVLELQGEVEPLQKVDAEWNTVYRVNCGGSDYYDAEGNLWMADVHKSVDSSTWGSLSWTDDYEGMPSFYGSQRQTYDPIAGTNEWPLLQTFRYGKHKLKYQFPVPNGQYKVELYFIEPWYGTGGGLECYDWRLFDVAINSKTEIHDLDIWEEVGHDAMLKKEIFADVSGGVLEISFPKVKSGQAVLSAIAISSANKDTKPAPSSPHMIQDLKVHQANVEQWKADTWLNTGNQMFVNVAQNVASLPAELYGAEWIKGKAEIEGTKGDLILNFNVNNEADVYIGLDTLNKELPSWMNGFLSSNKNVVSNDGTVYQLYQKRLKKGEQFAYYKLSDKSIEAMSFIAVVQASSLDKAIDLRKAVTYQAEDGKRWGSAQQVKFMKKDCIKLSNSQASIGFVFKVGLASKYGLQFRYMNMSDKNMEMDVEILANDGRLMWQGEWTLPSAPIKWKSFRTDTQTTINAGTYTIKMTPKGNGPVYFDWVKVQ